MRQILYDYVKGQKSRGPNTKSCQKQFNLNFKVDGERRIDIIIMVKHPCAKYGMSRTGHEYAHKDIQTYRQNSSYKPPEISSRRAGGGGVNKRKKSNPRFNLMIYKRK